MLSDRPLIGHSHSTGRKALLRRMTVGAAIVSSVSLSTVGRMSTRGRSTSEVLGTISPVRPVRGEKERRGEGGKEEGGGVREGGVRGGKKGKG